MLCNLLASAACTICVMFSSITPSRNLAAKDRCVQKHSQNNAKKMCVCPSDQSQVIFNLKQPGFRHKKNSQKSGTESLSSGTISSTTSTKTTMARNVVTSREILSSRSVAKRTQASGFFQWFSIISVSSKLSAWLLKFWKL